MKCTQILVTYKYKIANTVSKFKMINHIVAKKLSTVDG